MQSYSALEAFFRKYYAVRSASSILNWDSATMLPSGSAEPRAEQLSALSEIAHGIITDPRIQELLQNAKHANLNEWQAANVREMERSFIHENALSAKLAAEFTRATSLSEMQWREARKNNDFKTYIPYLKQVVALVREMAQAKAQALNLSPYDALIDQFDPGSKSADIDIIFDDLADFLPDFTQNVLESQKTKPMPHMPELPVPVEKQRLLSAKLMEKLGFDFTRGRLDESAHPFCGGVPGDVRLTTKYNEREFLQGLLGVIHETGHALYEMQLPLEWRNQPVGEARGMMVHESQSLFFEKQIGHSREFISFLVPLLKEVLGVSGPAWQEDNLYAYANQVQPGFIRIHADEVTYPSHILLRYRLEKALLDNELEVEDLPAAWNEGMQKLLGITPPTDSVGCLQDIHWPEGMFGYFPSYTLGAMLAAQEFAALQKDLPDIKKHIQKGDFMPITHWLKNHIHQYGSLYQTPQLIAQATGQALNPAIYKQHLSKRYLENA